MEPNLLEELYKQVSRIDIKQEFKKLEPNNRTTHTCSFCGKNESEVKSLVLGPLVAICDSCLDFGKQIAEGKSNELD
ncbi:ATP-dependent Clp protease ATP-binding subunit ClpX [compost metagenome]